MSTSLETATVIQRRAGAGQLAPLAPGSPPRTIRQGSRGEDVRHAQDRINAHGAQPPLATDGIFGPLTRRGTVGYQRTHGLDPDGIIGPRTSVSLDGPTDVGGSSGQSATPPSGAPPASVLRYDTAAYRLSPPARGTTMVTLRAWLTAKQTSTPPDIGPTVTVLGVTAGTQQELFVWNALLQLSSRARWGTEADIVTQIGPAPVKPPGPAPVGRVTVRIDAQGNAAATLIAAGPVAAAPLFPDRAAATTALQALGFATVQDGSAPWTLPDLSKVHAALSRLPAADRAAFAGVDLIRELTLTDSTGQALAGQFSHRASLATGATTATRSASLKIANSAFGGDDVSFIGNAASGGPASFETIVHEAGHAVETKALRDAQFATLEAQGVLNGKITAQNAAVVTFNAAMNRAFATAARYPRAQRQQAGGYRRGINNATARLRAMSQNNTAANNAALDTSAIRAVAARDRARAALATSTPQHPALADFTATVTAQDAWLTAARDRAAANATVEQRRQEETAVSGATAGQSLRLQNFVTHVTRNRIPPLTEYARRNWPAHPDEFFAEAYSLWQNDREYLQTNAPTLVTWFDTGEHLK